MPRLLLLLIPVLLLACEPTPRPLVVGEDYCVHCRMAVSDDRYGAEIVTTTGKVLPFDAVECLQQFLKENDPAIHSLWVVDFRRPGTLIPADSAHYLQTEQLPSPMGANLTAFGPTADPESLKARYGGEVYQWHTLPHLAAHGAAQERAQR